MGVYKEPRHFTSKEGQKDDGEKPPIGLLDRYMVEEVARVMGFGAEKYGRHNWRKGIAVQRNLDAALRHIFAFNDGEDTDPESGRDHLAHAICCLMFAMSTAREKPDLDDRYNGGIKITITSDASHKPLAQP